MEPTTEQVSIWILTALKAEWERDQSLLTCQTQSAILNPLLAEHCIESTDIDRAIKFLAARGMLEALNRKDGRASFPSMKGFDYLDASLIAQKVEVHRKEDVRLKLYPIIIAILGLVIAYLTYWGYKLSK